MKRSISSSTVSSKVQVIEGNKIDQKIDIFFKKKKLKKCANRHFLFLINRQVRKNGNSIKNQV